MLKIKKQSYWRKVIQSLLLKGLTKLENNNNADLISNGEEHFINQYFDFLNKSDSDPIVVFDVGANVGDYSDLVSQKLSSLKLAYKIHLFEPTQDCYDILQQKFSDYQSIFVNHFGCSDAEESRTIYYDQKRSGLASLYHRNLRSYALELNQTEQVYLQRLDTHIAKYSVTKIDLLKIDVEGHELSVLQGLGKHLNPDFINTIQFEYGGANLDSKTSLLELYTCLSNSGFVLTKIMPTFLEIREYRPHMENFQYANYLAVSPRIIDKLL
ncbi:MAG: FkbM family methyltransferase [Microcystaceae cyanobacterium]